jgi:hypothetical protein
VVLNFSRVDKQSFRIVESKFRPDQGNRPSPLEVGVSVAEDGSLVLNSGSVSAEERLHEIADVAVELILAADEPLSTRQLESLVSSWYRDQKRRVGTQKVRDALALLEAEDPPRVKREKGHVRGKDGVRRSAKVWMRAACAPQPQAQIDSKDREGAVDDARLTTTCSSGRESHTLSLSLEAQSHDNGYAPGAHPSHSMQCEGCGECLEDYWCPQCGDDEGDG